MQRATCKQQLPANASLQALVLGTQRRHLLPHVRNLRRHWVSIDHLQTND